jgi:anti-sigma regulatory factor (Ser/Thr protein kinase)
LNEVSAAYPVLVSGSGTARCVRVFPGEPRQVPLVRAWVARTLAGCPAREDLVTCVSELAANAIEHTASGVGGEFTVEVAWPADGAARVAVTDAGSPGEPAAGQAAWSAEAEPAEAEPAEAEAPDDDYAGLALDEGGRGLILVAACSSRWGYGDAGADEGAGRTVWAEATWAVAAVA